MLIEKYGRNWAVKDDNGDLICVTVYKKGAKEVCRRLRGIDCDGCKIPEANTSEKSMEEVSQQ